MPDFATPWTAVYQAPPSMGFFRQKYWSFSFSIDPSNEYSGLISFRTDWLDLLTYMPSIGIWTKVLGATLAWKIPWMEEPGRLQSIRSQRVRHD